MLKRLPGFILLTVLFMVLVFMDGYAGTLLFLVEAMFFYWLAAKEMSGMMEKMGRPVFPQLVMRSGWLWIFGVGLVLAGEVQPGKWDQMIGVTRSIQLLQPEYAIAVLAFLAFIPWLALPMIGPNKYNVSRIFNSITVFAMIALPLSALIPLYMIGGSCGYVACPLFLYLVAVTKIGDTGAYLVGSAMNKITRGGNHRIAPSISPNKSWEGAMGGMFCSVGMSVWLGGMLFPSMSLTLTIILGVLFFWGGFFGDLAESVMKRIAGVKDSGQLLPGLGGALDFLDALLINAPLFVFFIILYGLKV